MGLNPLFQQLLILCAVVILFGAAISVFAVLPHITFIVAMQVLMGAFVILVLYVSYRMFRDG